MVSIQIPEPISGKEDGINMMDLDFSGPGRKSFCPVWGEGGHATVSTEKGREVYKAIELTVCPSGSLLLVLQFVHWLRRLDE